MKTRLPAILIAAAVVSPTAYAQRIAADAPELVGFATTVEAFSPATPGDLSSDVNDPSAALGAPNVSFDPETFAPIGLVSLGDPPAGTSPGSITLGFNQAITDGTGADFAVFENASDFGTLFVELAFVEVSTNGTDFARFPTFSETTFDSTLFGVTPANTTPAATDLLPDFSGNQDFSTVPATNVITGFAGVDPGLFGTLFDLSALANEAQVLNGEVDLTTINFVRLVDVPGDGRVTDSQGNPIFDAFSPNNATGGFDLDAVGVLNTVPEPTAAALLALGGLALLRRRNA